MPPERSDSPGLPGLNGKRMRGGGGIFKSAAVTVLQLEGRLMTTGEITRIALEQSLINCQGRTPEATMASALYTDVKRKHDKSVFTRPQEGLFGLREWESDGERAACGKQQPDCSRSRPSSARPVIAAEIENLKPHEPEEEPPAPGSMPAAAADLSPRRRPASAALCESPIRLLQPEHHARMAPIDTLLHMPEHQQHADQQQHSAMSAETQALTPAQPEQASQTEQDQQNSAILVFRPSWSAPLPELEPQPLTPSPHFPPSYHPDSTASSSTLDDTGSLIMACRMLSHADSGSALNLRIGLTQPQPRNGMGPLPGTSGKRIRSRSASPPKLPKLAAVDRGTLLPWTPPRPHTAASSPVTPPLDALLQEPCPLASPCMQWLRLFRGNPCPGTLEERTEHDIGCQPGAHAAFQERATGVGDTRQAQQGHAAASPPDAMLPCPHQLQPSTSAGICCAEEEVKSLEHRLGTAHPRVGKALLQLSRAYSLAGGPAYTAKAEQALLRAWHICSSFYAFSSHPPPPFNAGIPAMNSAPRPPAGTGVRNDIQACQGTPELSPRALTRLASLTQDFLV